MKDRIDLIPLIEEKLKSLDNAVLSTGERAELLDKLHILIGNAEKSNYLE